MRNVTVGFRLTVDGAPEGALLRYTGSSIVRVWLNGEFFAYGPARGPHGIDRVDEIPLSGKLRDGRNEFAFEVAGYNVESFYLLNEPAYLQAEVVTADGRVLAATAPGTDARIVTERVRKVPRFSYQRPFCEVYVLAPGFDAWRTGVIGEPVETVAVAGSRLMPRVFPYPPMNVSRRFDPMYSGGLAYDAGKELHPGRSVTGEGESKRGYSEEECVAQPAKEIQRLNNETGRAPLAPAGSYALSGRAYAMFDHGLCDTGFLGFSLKCEKPGRLYFVFDESLFEGDVNPIRQTWQCVSAVTLELTKPGEYRFEAFEPNTFRYLKVLSDGFSGSVSDLYLREYKNGDAGRAAFHSSDPGLDRVFDAARETFVQNAVDAFTDCPSRERAGWLCDSFFTGRAAQLLTGKTDVERGFLQNYALCPRVLSEGFLPMCYPADSNLLPNWNFFLVFELEEYLARSGDRALVDEARPAVMRMVEAFRRYRNADGLLEDLPGWIFVEWSEANKLVRNVNYPSNMTYAEFLASVARIYGDGECAAEAERVRETVRRQSWTGEWFCDNAVRGDDGKLSLSGECTETCQYYAFFFKTATKELYPELWRRLVEDFGPGRKLHPETDKWPKIHPSNAFIGNFLRLECLSREGMSGKILDETKGYLLKMADLTGTLWEMDDTHASLCHGFASHAAVTLFRDILGVRRVDYLNRTVEVSPPADVPLSSCSGTMPTPEGDVTVSWHRAGDGSPSVQVSLPEGWRRADPR